MTLTLRDRVAEAMRESRIGRTRFGWDQCDQEEWRRSADALMRYGRHLGFEIVETGNIAHRPAPPVTPVIYALDDARDASVERSVRCDGAGNWSIVSTKRDARRAAIDSKTLLTFTLAEADLDCDRILAGDPTAKDIKGVLTKVAAANVIRTLNAETMEPS
ncbi:hypothetical protein NKL07_21980 [Mesorhizobium sp. C280B]|uniref:hypothetical protein n=1 Tax=unclassified Mesorhizobium TaxID=325217 RepID=UPI0003CF322B|nr:hypothetical protein [Mesorhizobium sp. LSJC280B00]ESW92948.1 hypothetical protein X772_03080 [Mesorhizobium sp. LSJC280B00]